MYSYDIYTGKALTKEEAGLPSEAELLKRTSCSEQLSTYRQLI